MKKAKRLVKLLKKAIKNNDIPLTIKLTDELKVVIDTYKVSC